MITGLHGPTVIRTIYPFRWPPSITATQSRVPMRRSRRASVFPASGCQDRRTGSKDMRPRRTSRCVTMIQVERECETGCLGLASSSVSLLQSACQKRANKLGALDDGFRLN
jgi:hypothetical protein